MWFLGSASEWFARWSVLLLMAWIGSPAMGQLSNEPLDWTEARELHPGIRLLQIKTANPRPMMVHAVRVELNTPNLSLVTSPGAPDWVENQTEAVRETTRDFMRRERSAGREVVLAVNADSFSPWPAPYQQATPTNIGGLAISHGVVISPPAGTPSLLVDASGEASIAVTTDQTNLQGIQLAVSGFRLCLCDGQVQPAGQDLHPRTGLGLSADGNCLLIVAIDGRRYSSQGATIQELGEWLKRLGAHQGINMDGGGSTTLAWWNPSQDLTEVQRCELINSPVGNGLKHPTPEKDAQYRPTERANGNNLGVYYQVAP
jgi:hypothetical protein